ncbi:OmpA-OmpF porin, OOP family [Paracoccus homiensis]|uniref:OmpA-OmpF porin, OOP family n=2 Tax=Paracoccus homiensis TaxID=364199 RepID=A0A1I0AJJ3_9RHOB|nr:OmpA-OmpF porin, OOP family [Paracoccus homiensis]
MASSRSRRMSTSLATLITLAGAAGLSWWGAQSAAQFIETRSRQDVTLALATAGQDWVQVETNGLQVRLTGTAPTEVDRFRAVTQAGSVVDSSRVVDDMTVASRDAMVPPEFKVELLRNDDGISLIGLVPAKTDREALVRSLRTETAAPKVTDLLESAEYAVPEGWADVLAYGQRIAQMTPRAKISIAPGEVQVTALADSRAEKGRLEAELKRLAPKGIKLVTNISAPRPVVAPFTLRFLIDDQGPHFDACAADTEAAQKQILDAAVRAGVDGNPTCTLALGSPTADWAGAAVPAIKAVAALGKGSVTISDADIALIAPEDVPADTFAEVVATLEQTLPSVFSLQAQHEEKNDATQGPAEFAATLSSDGRLSMRGRIADQQMREAVDSFARARFSTVSGNLRGDASMPSGWTVRVIAALEALDGLANGTITVTPDLIELGGTSGDPRATERAAASLSRRLGAGADYQLAIRYDRWMDAALALPDGQYCVDQLNIVMSESEIGFEPSKSTIAGDPAPTLSRLAGIMQDCADYQIEAGGHTDSQGSEGFNADLSRARAQALLKAMSDAGIDTSNMTSRGYGESQPIASNDSEAGREENRRIEFRLLSESPVRNEPLPAPVVLEGVTSDASANAETAQPDVTAEQGRAMAYGPQLPTTESQESDGDADPAPVSTAPATLGVTEQFQTLDEREENLRLPVQTPDADTPRPEKRPDDEDGADETTAADETAE